MLSLKLKGKQSLRGICYPERNGENCNFFKCPFFAKITVFLFSPHATKAGGRGTHFLLSL